MWIIRCMPNTSVGGGLLAKASAQQTLMLTDPSLSRASPLPQGSATPLHIKNASLHPQHNLADMIPTFHPRMGLGGVGIGVDLVDHRQATPGTE